MSENCPICRVMGSSRVKESVWIRDENNSGNYLVVPTRVYNEMCSIAEKGNCHIDINGRIQPNRKPYFGKCKTLKER